MYNGNSNYPSGVRGDNDSYFTDTNEYDEEEPDYLEAELHGTPWPNSSHSAATFEYEDAHGLRIR